MQLNTAPTPKVMVIAPHPDDETLGCGGTLLRHVQQNHEIHWVILTDLPSSVSFTAQRALRKQVTDAVANAYPFKNYTQLPFPTTALDQVPFSDMVEALGACIREAQPNILYVPFFGDIHSDHRIGFAVAQAASKWFRYPSIEKIYAYETLSETELALQREHAFFPNVFVDISAVIKQKLAILQLYRRELAEFPFPRSLTAVEALARYRGAAGGMQAAESFMLLRERCM